MEIKEDKINDILKLYEDLNAFLKNMVGINPNNPVISTLLTETDNSQSQFYLLCKFIASYGSLTKSLSILMNQLINLTPDGIESLKPSLTEFLDQVLKAQDSLFENENEKTQPTGDCENDD